MNKHHPPMPLLHKQHSWSPDIHHEEVWLRRKESRSLRRTKKRTVTDDDLEELKGCIELGFGFDSSTEVDPKLADTLPALGLYQSVHRQYHRSLSRSSSAASFASSSSLEDIIHGDDASSIYDPGDDPATVKTRLRQWAPRILLLNTWRPISAMPIGPNSSFTDWMHAKEYHLEMSFIRWAHSPTGCMR